MKFFIPYVYGISTRAKSLFYKISFIAYILVPNLLPILVNSGAGFDGSDILRFVIGFTAMYCVYEIGYLQNDTYTVRMESEPTYRLSSADREFVEKHALLLVSSRLIEIIATVSLLWHLRAPHMAQFIIALCVMYLGYAFYNSYRNRSNIISIFFVLVGKYCAVPALFIPVGEHFVCYMSILLAIPIFRTLEEAKTAKRYGFKTKLFAPERVDGTRVGYYLLLTILSLALLAVNQKIFWPAVLLFGYLFLFRALCYLASRNKKVLANREKCQRIRE